MPINLSDTGCLASVNVTERIDGNIVNQTYSGIASLNCLPFIIQNVIFWLLVFAGTVALILVIIAGIKFITSGGDAKQAEGARKTLTFAILGLILIMFSFAIVRFIAQTTGLNCITKFGFSACQDPPPQEFPLPACGRNNPHGICTDPTKKCVPIKGQLNNFECRKPCADYNDCDENQACGFNICISCSETNVQPVYCGPNKWCQSGSCVTQPL